MFVKNVSFVTSPSLGGSLVVGIYEDGTVGAGADVLGGKIVDEIAQYVRKTSFYGKLFESFSFVSSFGEHNHVLVIGLGKFNAQFSDLDLEKIGAAIYTGVKKLDKKASVAIGDSDIKSNAKMPQLLLAFGSLLKSWDFDKYKPTKNEKVKLSTLEFCTGNVADAEFEFKKYKNIADAVFLARSVVSEPANVINPLSLAAIAEQELAPLGINIKVLDPKVMQDLGMNALLGVAQGSANEPRMAVLSWNGGDASDKPVAFVGKGVTFDSGGISLKPEENMHEMTYDMAGSGVVLGLLKAVALNKLPINVVGIMAMVENMPSGTAQRPGDIVKTMSGKTVEIRSTDAEGRLVLADAIWYVEEKFSPKIIIDIATLTGAIVVALGHEFAGLFTNSDELAKQLIESGDATGEKIWRMPLTEHFDKSINSEVADMLNTSKPSTRGGSITAAQFIKRFIRDVSWAHLDIAGVECTSDEIFVCTNGATGFGVHLLYDFLERMLPIDCVLSSPLLRRSEA
ncbi:MAG: leucyl aminopeptidase [Holosporaceae bacterium]|jgi:leucyl aminopeptidase|nr:leucyl aminopeptidase [Holosporaceae bacterium]